MSDFSEGLALQINMLARIQLYDNTSIDYACNTLALVSARMLCVPRLHGGVGIVDCSSRQPAYKISVVIAPCER